MPNILPNPVRVMRRIVSGAHDLQRQYQSRPRSGGGELTSAISRETQSTQPALPEAASRADEDLRRCAWNGSIGDGILRKIHREHLAAINAVRMANAARFSTLSNRLAALEAELSVLVEQPPKQPPTPKILNIHPTSKGA